MSQQGGVISYPVPAWQNAPIDAQFYQPSVFVISNVTLGRTTTVTSLSTLNYVVGQLVRLLIPTRYGSFQLNNASGYVVTIISDNSVELNIDSSNNVNTFIIGTSTPYPQILAIGDVNQGYISSTGSNIPSVTIPGAFINIS